MASYNDGMVEGLMEEWGLGVRHSSICGDCGVPAADQGFGASGLRPLASGPGPTSEVSQTDREMFLVRGLFELFSDGHAGNRPHSVLSLERHRHGAESWRALARAVGGRVARSGESGVKEGMVGRLGHACTQGPVQG